MPSHPPGAGWNGTLAGRVLKWRPFSRFPRRARPIANVLVNLAGLAFFIITAGLSAGWLAEVR